LHFSGQEQHDEFLEKIKDGVLKVGGPSSWTPSKSTAQDFAHSKKSYFPTPELMYASDKMQKTGDHMAGYGGVVLKTKVGPGVGCDLSKTEFQKESEVILKPGTYQVEIEELMEPYHRKYNTPEKLEVIFNELKKAKDRTDDLTKKATYVRRSWFDKLSPEQADILMKYELNRFLTMPAGELERLGAQFKIEEDYFNKGSHRLSLDVYVGVDIELYEKCSDKMQALVDKRIKIVVNGLTKAVKAIASHENVSTISEFRIYGVKHLMKFFPTETAAAVKPLRKVLSDRYHFLNSRENSKKLQTQDDIRKHGETIASVVGAMANL
uniref:hypothetical protein n=1 Tax=Acinetobacter sp. TaxID=472 RepID=UPI00388E0ED0